MFNSMRTAFAVVALVCAFTGACQQADLLAQQPQQAPPPGADSMREWRAESRTAGVASRWRPVRRGIVWDAGTVVRTDTSMYRVWVSFSFDTTGIARIPRGGVLRARFEYDCVLRQARTIESTMYDSLDMMRWWDREAGEWSEVPPQTAEDAVLTNVCTNGPSLPIAPVRIRIPFALAGYRLGAPRSTLPPGTPCRTWYRDSDRCDVSLRVEIVLLDDSIKNIATTDTVVTTPGLPISEAWRRHALPSAMRLLGAPDSVRASGDSSVVGYWDTDGYRGAVVIVRRRESGFGIRTILGCAAEYFADCLSQEVDGPPRR